MEKFMQAVNRFIRDEEGATAIEYGLIAALISIVMLIALTGVGQGVRNTFTRICNAFVSAGITGLTCG
jgi:pilus assembly protein Flp/PilA